MNSEHIRKLEQMLPDINKWYFRQVFVFENVDSHTVRSFSEQQKIPYININLELSRELRDVPQNRRVYKVSDSILTLLRSNPEKIICLDYYELLFNDSLSINVFDLFKNASRNKTLIIAWRGKLTEKEFIYAEPGHPEYTRYPIHETIVIN